MRRIFVGVLSLFLIVAFPLSIANASAKNNEKIKTEKHAHSNALQNGCNDKAHKGHGFGHCDHPHFYAPVIESVAPDRVHIDGGARVRLKGKGFARMPKKAPTVMLGDVKIKRFIIKKRGTRLKFKAPAVDHPQTIDLKVFNRGGVASHPFVYFSGEMKIDGIEPSSGPVCCQTDITLTGTNFTYNEDTEVTIGGKPLLNVNVVSDKIITGTIPPGITPGTVSVTVSCSNARIPLSIDFTYTRLEIHEYYPSSGPVCGGIDISLTGSGFTDYDDMEVTVGGETVPIVSSSISSDGEGTIYIKTPISNDRVPQAVDITVRCSNGTAIVPFQYIAHELKGWRGTIDYDNYGNVDYNPTIWNVGDTMAKLDDKKDIYNGEATRLLIDSNEFRYVPNPRTAGWEQKARHWQSIQFLHWPSKYCLLSVSDEQDPDNSKSGIYLAETWGDSMDKEGKLISFLQAPKRQTATGEELYYDHFGGMQVIGGYVAVAAEHSKGHLPPMVFFYDTKQVETYQKITKCTTEIDCTIDGSARGDLKSSAVGVAKLEDGRFLVAVVRQVGQPGETIIAFYRSTKVGLDVKYQGWEHMDTWYESWDWPDADNKSFPSCGFQNINLVVDAETGTINLIGMSADATWFCGDACGDDEAFTYPIHFSDDCPSENVGIHLESRVNIHMVNDHYGDFDCCWTGGLIDRCDAFCKPSFDAGSGLRLYPTGSPDFKTGFLIRLYATEHYTSWTGLGWDSRGATQVSYFTPGNKDN